MKNEGQINEHTRHCQECRLYFGEFIFLNCYKTRNMLGL